MLDCLIPGDAQALPLHLVTRGGLEALLQRLPPGQAAFLRASGFTAKAQEWRLLPSLSATGGSGIDGAVAGLGDDAASHAASPWAYGGLPMALPGGTYWRLEGESEAVTSGLGWCLGAGDGT